MSTRDPLPPAGSDTNLLNRLISRHPGAISDLNAKTIRSAWPGMSSFCYAVAAEDLNVYQGHVRLAISADSSFIV